MEQAWEAGAGVSAAAKADALRAKGRPSANSWAKGADGERATPPLLVSLAEQGWQLLNDRAVPGSAGNIDHLLIGPGGVVVLDSKNWAGRVTLSKGTLWNNRLPRNREL